MSSIIKYRISSITSQSLNYPISNLVDNYTSLGWQSEYSATYPQQLNIKFFLPIRTKTLKLIFHQYKIPSWVQIFVRLSNKQNFRKLGYIKPNDNSQSNYQHKQIKTLYFQFPCTQIKFVFYQNYKNQMNVLQQIALEDLIVEGEVLSVNQTKHVSLDDTQTSEDEDEEDESIANNSKNNSNQNNNNKKNSKLLNHPTTSDEELNKLYIEILSNLQTQKEHAIQNQDFQKASGLKSAGYKFKELFNEIIQIEQDKKQALEDEDFDKCHKMKQEINRKKQLFLFMRDELYENGFHFIAETSFEKVKRSQHNLQSYSSNMKHQDIKDYFNSTPNNKGSINNFHIELQQNNRQNQNKQQRNNTHDDQVVPALRNKGKTIDYNLVTQQSEYESTTNKKNGLSPKKFQPVTHINHQLNKSNIIQNNKSIKGSQYLVIRQQGNQNSDYWSKKEIKQQKQEQIQQEQQQIGNDENNDNKLGISRFELLKIEDIEDKTLRIKLQHHFIVLPYVFWKMIIQKNWQYKKQALQYLNENYMISSKQQFMTLLEFISYSIADSHPQVILETLKLFNKLIQQSNNNNLVFSLNHIPYFVDDIINVLLNNLNNTNKQVLEESYYIYLHLGLISFLPLNLIINKIIKHKQTSKVDLRQKIQKITLMVDIVEKYAQATTKYCKEIVQWAVGYLDEPNNKVKNQASSLLSILVNQVGEQKVISLIKSQKHQKMFLAIYNLNSLANNSKFQQNQQKINQNFNNSKLQDDKNQSHLPKSKQKNNSSISKNQSNLLANRSHISKQNQSQVYYYKNKQSQRMKNPWMGEKKHSKDSSKQQMNIELEYSRQSDFYQQSNSEKILDLEQEQQNYIKQKQNKINVMDESGNNWNQDQDQENQNNMDSDYCDYCCQNMNGLNQREHLIRECKVIAYCEDCQGRIYIREITDHLLQECNNKAEYQRCQTCGLAFNISEINQHVGRGLCRLKKGDNWERCQFCALDILNDDNKWIQHAFDCPNLPEIPLTQIQNTDKSF